MNVFLKKQQGFSLVEMMVVLLILGVVFGGGAAMMSAFNHSANTSETQHNLVQLKKEVLNFGLINKYLPCPDTDLDGLENRVAAGGFQACAAARGGVPYLDLGLTSDSASDAWGNTIRYAVNSDTTNGGVICDKTRAASMFCNQGAASGVTWFNLSQTPPLFGNRGSGNYYVCNESAANCSGTPVAANLESDSAVVVMVAYNQDGSAVATPTGCAASTGAINENCDTDLYYHQAARTNAEGAFFDDVILAITGQEVKALLLNEQLSWNSFSTTGGTSPITPTYEDFDITSSDTMSEIATTGEDVVFVRRNVEEALSLGAGDDYISIGNDLESGATLKTNTGDDSVYILGNMYAEVLLGAGDDSFVLATNLSETLKAQTGDDKVWIQGDVLSGALLQMNDGDDVLWLGDPLKPSSGVFDDKVNGGDGYDILVLENVDDWSDLSSSQTNLIRQFELVIFKDDGTGSRNYHICNNVNNRCR